MLLIKTTGVQLVIAWSLRRLILTCHPDPVFFLTDNCFTVIRHEILEFCVLVIMRLFCDCFTDH